MADEAWGIDFEGEIAVIVDDVPMGATVDAGARARSGWSCWSTTSRLRSLIPAELAKGFGFFQSKPSSAFSPVAVTPDELGDAWDGGKLHLPLLVDLNGKPFGRADAGVDMTFDFGQLDRPCGQDPAARRRHDHRLGHRLQQARRRPGQAGVAKAASAIPASPSCAWSRPSRPAQPSTPFLRFGDIVRIEMKDKAGHSIFGAIEQTVTKYEKR